MLNDSLFITEPQPPISCWNQRQLTSFEDSGDGTTLTFITYQIAAKQSNYNMLTMTHTLKCDTVSDGIYFEV